MVEVNAWAILAAGVAGFATGGLWYSPALFMKAWTREIGMAPGAPARGPARVYGLSFLFTLITAFALALLVGPHPPPGVAITTGVVVGACLVAPSMGINYQFANRSPRLFLIDGGFHVARFAVMGAVLGAWP